MKVAVKDLLRDLQEQMDMLTSIKDETVEVHYLSDNLEGYGDDFMQIKHINTHISVIEDGGVCIHTEYETV